MTRTGMTGVHRPDAQTTTWLTPLSIIEALGPFDFDPCGLTHWPTAHEINEWPSDGLSLDWSNRGRIWLNPPYGKETWVWLERLADHGDGVALTFARTETSGFERAIWLRADAILFVWGRLTFYREDGTPGRGNAGAPSVLVAYGQRNVEALRRCGLAGYLVTQW